MTLRSTRVFAAVGLLLASCGGDATGRRDPLTSSFDLLNGAEPIYASGVDGLAGTADRPWRFGLYLGPSCLVAGVDDAYSDCTSARPGDASTAYDGGVHDDVSLAWVVSGDEQVVSARFWMLDGTTFEQPALVVGDRDDPPIVFGHAVAATNEIVGIELLDSHGHVVTALSIDPEA